MNLKKIKVGMVLLGLVLGLGAGGNVNASEELIINGGFEDYKLGWELTGTPIPAVVSANGFDRSGTYYAVLGEVNSNIDFLKQTVTIPANTDSAVLTFYYNISSDETTVTNSYDLFMATIHSTSGTRLALVRELSNLDKDLGPGNPYYHLETFNMNAFIGQTVEIRFSSMTDNSNSTTFRVDDVSLITTTVPPPAKPGNFSLSNETPICDTNYPEGPAIRLNWGSASGATSYHVYRNGSPYENVATDTTFYNSASVTAERTYTYYIQARNASGYTNSNTISVYVESDICNTSPQPSCYDGIQNQNETGIDCGGVCPSCASGSDCGNGIIEGDEECDDGNIVNGDGCNGNCLLEETGNDITYYFSGQFMNSFGNLSEGVSLCGSFSYDRSQSLNTPTHPYMGMYTLKNMLLTVNSETVFSGAESLGLFVFDHDANGGYPPEPEAAEPDKRITGYPFDYLIVSSGQVSGILGGIRMDSYEEANIHIDLKDLSGTVFDSPAIPSNDLHSDDFLSDGHMSISLDVFNFNEEPLTAHGEIVELSALPMPGCILGTIPQCSDGIDNDGDGLTDYPNDLGCENAEDDDEVNSQIDTILDIPFSNQDLEFLGLSGPSSLPCYGDHTDIIATPSMPVTFNQIRAYIINTYDEAGGVIIKIYSDYEGRPSELLHTSNTITNFPKHNLSEQVTESDVRTWTFPETVLFEEGSKYHIIFARNSNQGDLSLVVFTKDTHESIAKQLCTYYNSCMFYSNNDLPINFVTDQIMQCSDGIDNDGDGNVDINDPQCHTDGNALNLNSYEPQNNDEVNPQTSTLLNIPFSNQNLEFIGLKRKTSLPNYGDLRDIIVTPSASVRFNQVNAYVVNTYAKKGEVIIKIHSDSDGKPGALLYTSDNITNFVECSTLEQIVVDDVRTWTFPETVLFEAGNVYHVVFKRVNDDPYADVSLVVFTKDTLGGIAQQGCTFTGQCTFYSNNDLPIAFFDNQVTQCSDGIDNDGDGLADGDDSGCLLNHPLLDEPREIEDQVQSFVAQFEKNIEKISSEHENNLLPLVDNLIATQSALRDDVVQSFVSIILDSLLFAVDIKGLSDQAKEGIQVGSSLSDDVYNEIMEYVSEVQNEELKEHAIEELLKIQNEKLTEELALKVAHLVLEAFIEKGLSDVDKIIWGDSIEQILILVEDMLWEESADVKTEIKQQLQNQMNELNNLCDEVRSTVYSTSFTIEQFEQYNKDFSARKNAAMFMNNFFKSYSSTPINYEDFSDYDRNHWTTIGGDWTLTISSAILKGIWAPANGLFVVVDGLELGTDVKIMTDQFRMAIRAKGTLEMLLSDKVDFNMFPQNLDGIVLANVQNGVVALQAEEIPNEVDGTIVVSKLGDNEVKVVVKNTGYVSTDYKIFADTVTHIVTSAIVLHVVEKEYYIQDVLIEPVDMWKTLSPNESWEIVLDIPYLETPNFLNFQLIAKKELALYGITSDSIQGEGEIKTFGGWLGAIIGSPGELRVYDSLGNVTGLIDDEVIEKIPNSIYDTENHAVIIFDPLDINLYRYEIVGIEKPDEKTYDLKIASIEDSSAIAFIATDISTTPNQVHQFSIDWQALSQGEKGVTMEIDEGGDGIFEETIITDATMEPPIADIGESYESAEGSEIIFDASQSTDADGNIVLYEWDFDGDGDYDESSILPTIVHTYGDDYNGEVTLRVTDEEGLTDTDTAEVIVNNVDPIVEAGADKTIQYSDPVQFGGSFTDPGWLDTHIIEWDFGDGVTIMDDLEPIHHYLAPGVYTAILTVTDDDGGIGQDSLVVNIIKESVTITVENQEGFFGDTVVLKAIVSDNDGEKLYHGPYEASFMVGDHQVGEAIINESGEVEIDWVVDYIPTDLNGTYTILVSFAGNEYYSSSEGQGEFTLKSAKQLKENALEKLMTVTTDNEQVQKEIDKAIEDIENSLVSELWTDLSRLDQQQGHKVFDREKQAVKSLLKIIEEKGKYIDPEVVAELQGVINNLVKVDILLAKTAIYDAENIEVDDTDLQKKIDDKINKAKEEMEKASQELADDNPDKAIDYLKKAWKSAQLAIPSYNC